MYPKIGFIDTYSLCIAIGIVFCFLFLELFFSHYKESRKLLSYFEVLGALSIGIGFLFAVLFQNLYDFIESPSTYSWSWSMTFYGGLIGGVLFFLLGYYLIVRKKYPGSIKELLIIAPSSIAIAQGLGRIGCFMAGCCYGIETDSWIGVTFPGMSHKVMPTNLFEAVFLIVFALILFFLAYKKRSPFCMPIYLIGYGIWRFTIEFYRGDHRGSLVYGLSPSQFWSIVIFVIGIAYLVFLIWRKKKETAH